MLKGGSGRAVPAGGAVRATLAATSTWCFVYMTVYTLGEMAGE